MTDALANPPGESFEAFKERVNLIFVVDHAGRAGNGFFQTIFDQHPQVIACPWMHYVYSYVMTEYGEDDELDARAVWQHWRGTIYFALLYEDLNEERRAFITRIGGNPAAVIDRQAVRDAFDGILLDRDRITRKDLVLAIFYSYAVGLGRDTGRIAYVMSPDSISLRSESAMSGFSGRVVDLVLSDFPTARLIHLERDPRAGFASSNHQFVNQLGNMYGLKFGNFWQRLRRLLRRDFDWDSVFVFGFWLIYFRQTFDAVMRKHAQYPERFTTLLNEDLNLDFVNTVGRLADDLGVDRLDNWTEDFQPTMLGMPWTGTGAYNSQYQKHRFGPLRNDPDKVARGVTGPNAYVTQRWRSRMSADEIFIVEALLAPELEAFGYDFLHWHGGEDDERRLSRTIWKPLSGELPSLRWVLDGRNLGTRELADRVFYCFAFPVFYLAARLVFLSLIRNAEIFRKP
jgi:hypothetical protein